MDDDAQFTTGEFYVETTKRLVEAFEHAHRSDSTRLTDALNAMCTEAHFRRLSPQAIEIAMRVTWSQVRRPNEMSEVEWSRLYYAALGQCLTSYFGVLGDHRPP